MSTEKLTQCARNVLDAWSETGWNVGFDAAMRAMREALAAHEALAAVPVEPRQITEAMHVAACKVLTRASGLDGTPQRMLDAMLAAAPQPQQSENTRVTPEQLTALRRGLHTGKIVPPVATPPQPTAPQQALQTRLDDYATEINRLRNVIQAACIGGTDYMIERWKNLFPDAPVPTVKPQQAGRDCPHCNYSGTAHCGDVAAQIKANGGEPGNCSNAHAYGLRSTPAQGACQHKRYTVDVREQTGNCIDCGAEGAMRFVVPQPQQAGVAPTDAQILAEARQWGDAAERSLGNGSSAVFWTFHESRLLSMVRRISCAQHQQDGVAPSLKESFDADAFYAALDRARTARNATWKQVGEATGVSQTTLSRMQSGRKPDAASLAALSAWAGLTPAKFLAAPPPQPTAPAPQPEPLHLGACITDGKLHATVMRREANGYIAVVAAAEIDEVSLRAGDCHALMTAPAPQAQAVSQWQGIESAPKDQRVMLWGKFWNTRDSFQYPMIGMWNPHSELQRWEIIGCGLRFGVRPTHWMPIPEVPASAAQKEPT